MTYYPALVGSALLFSTIVVNLKEQNYLSSFLISLFSIPIVLFLVFLSQKNLDILAYLIIMIPVILLFVGFNLGINIETPVSNNSIPTAPPLNVSDRIEPKEGVNHCHMCNFNPCRCFNKV